MKRWLLPLALAAMLPTPASAGVIPDNYTCQDTAIDPARLALARDVINLSMPEDQFDQMFRQMMGSFTQVMQQSRDPGEFSDPNVKAIMDRRMKEIPDQLLPVVNRHMPQIFGAMACAYAKEFSVPELTELRNFVATPTGRRFMIFGPKVMSDPGVMQEFQTYMVEVQAVSRDLGDEIAVEIAEMQAKRKKVKK
jgi:hypothetical protein